MKAKPLPATLLFVDFGKAFESVHREKMVHILLSYGIPEETVSAIMMSRAIVRSTDGDTDFFEIKASVLQGDTLAPYLFVICQDNILRHSTDQYRKYGLTLTPVRGRRYPTKTITDVDYADDIVVLADDNDNAQKLLRILEESAAIIGLHTNAATTEYMSFHQDGQVETLNGPSPKNKKLN